MFWLSRLERKGQPLAPRSLFYYRLRRNFLVTLGIMAASLFVGTAGYRYLGGLSWIDGLLNAAMILTGMGPLDKPDSVAGKLFATAYALYSGIAFLTMTAVLVAPVYHRFIHHFHLAGEADGDDKGDEPGAKGDGRPQPR